MNRTANYFVLLLFSYCVSCAQPLTLSSVLPIAGNSLVSVQDCVVDTCGNLICIGIFRGDTEFNPAGSTKTLSVGQSKSNVFVCKFSPGGILTWVKQFEGDNVGIAGSVSIDLNGRVGVSMSFVGKIDLDPGPGTTTAISTGTSPSNAYVCLDKNGSFQFGFNLGSYPPSFAMNSRFRFGSNGDFFITGGFAGTVDLDPGSGVHAVISQTPQSLLICHFSASGQFVWGGCITGTGAIQFPDMMLDKSNNLTVCGTFDGTIDFDPSVASHSVTALNGDGFIMRLTSTGNFVWVKTLENFGSSNMYLHSLCDDSAGNVYVAGSFSDHVDFDPGVSTATVSSKGSYDSFVLKLDALGQYLWVTTSGGTGFDAGNSIRRQGTQLYVCGTFQSTVDFDPGAGIQNLVCGGNLDGFLQVLETTSVFSNVYQLQGSGNSRALTVATNAGRGLYFCGDFTQITDFDPSPTQYTLASYLSNSDGFICKLAHCIDAPAQGCGSNPTLYCAGFQATLNTIGGNGLNWFVPQSTVSVGTGSVYITPTLSVGTYIWIAASSNCTVPGNDAIFLVSVNASPVISVTPSTATVCEGDKLILSASGANSFAWSTQQSTSTITLIAGVSTTVSVTGVNSASCATTESISISVDKCTRMTFESVAGTFRIYPSPATENIIIESQVDGVCEIIDITGKVIHQLKISTGRNTSYIGELTPGCYFARLFSGSIEENHKILIGQWVD